VTIDAWSTLTDAVGSRERVLTASISLDVFWRLPEDILAPVLSLLGGAVSIQWVTTATTWLLFAVALYSLAHLGYTEWAFPEADTGIRALFAAASLWVCVIFLSSGSDRIPMFIGLVGTLVAGSLGFLYYLRRYQDWRLSAPDGQLAAILARFDPGARLDDEGRLRREDQPADAPLSRSYLLAGGMILTVPCLFGGMLVFFLFHTYPVPDLLFLGWVVATAANERGVGERGFGTPDVVWFDLEETLFDSLSNSTHGFIGFLMMLYAFFGLLSVALWLSVVVTFGPRFAGLAVQTGTALVDLVFTTVPKVGVGTVVGWPITRRLVFITWTLTGVFVLMGLTAVAGIWGWICQLRRIPQYLGSLDSPAAEAEPRVARPTGFILPAMVGIGVLGGYMGWRTTTDSLTNLPFALLWPVTAGAIVWSLRRIRTGPPQSFEYEYVLVVGGLAGQVLFLFFFVGDMAAVGAVIQGRVRAPDRMAGAVFTTGVVVLVGMLPYLAQKGGYWGFARVRDGGQTYEGGIERIHHGRGSVILHDVTTDEGEHLAGVFVRSPGTIAALEAGKQVESPRVDDLQPFPEHPQAFDPDDDIIRRCARNKYAGSFPVVRETGEILNGHKRVAAARRAGLESHPVEVLDVTDEQARELYQIAHRSHEEPDSGEAGEATDTDGEADT
jgi:ParB family chromosome partitioning protein